MRLVADIGGTNARLGLCASGVVDHRTVQRFSNADWPNLSAVLATYLASHPGVILDEMVIAVAGPVGDGRATLTNRNWTIDAAVLQASFNCDRAVLLNDLSALGYAVPMLRADQIVRVCGGDQPSEPMGQALVVGIGTGFNISQAITTSGGTVCPPAEAGHVSMPHSISKMLPAFNCDPEQFPTVETLFSGRGLTNFCQNHTGKGVRTGEDAIDLYSTMQGQQATDAINDYSTLLGWLLRDLALSYMPSHGIYLAGSVARAIAKTAPDPLAKVLQATGQFRSPKSSAVYTIEDDGAALAGCGRYSN